MGELCHVGARFEALDESVLTAPSVSSCIFFTILTLPSERCGKVPGRFFFLYGYKSDGYRENWTNVQSWHTNRFLMTCHIVPEGNLET